MPGGLGVCIPVCCGPCREGEFTVHALAFNDVSTASLRKQLFIVREPCQPPPVRNMGPGKVQVDWAWEQWNFGEQTPGGAPLGASEGPGKVGGSRGEGLVLAFNGLCWPLSLWCSVWPALRGCLRNCLCRPGRLSS